MRRLVVAGALGGAVALLVLFVVAAARVMSVPEEPAPAPTAATLPDDAGYAAWATTADGSPVRWNPCEPIRWVLDPTDAPPDARKVVSLAMARITAASGIEFDYLGTTDERPARGRSLVSGDGTAWAPVLVTWVPGGSTDLPLGDEERGVSVPVAVRDDATQDRVFVTGQVVFNSDKTLLPAFEDRHASWGAVVLHELAHLVGLDHVDDPRQLLHPTPGFGPVEFGDGDLAGLAAVGADHGCVTVPAPRELDVTFAPIS